MKRNFSGGIGRLLSLLASGVPVEELKNNYTELVVLAAKGSLQVSSIDISEINQSNPKNGITSLMSSSSAGHFDCVSSLIEQGASLNQTDTHGRNALFYAIYHNQEEIFNLLIEKGCDYQLQDDQGRNILHTASYFGRTSIVKIILNIRCDKSNLHNLILQKDNFGCTSFHYAVAQRNEEIADNLLQLQGETVLNEKDNKGISAFLYACQQAESDEWVEYLLDEGADIDTLDNDGQSALHYSVLSRNNDVIRTILCYFIENDDLSGLHHLLNQRACGGYTPLHYACLTENTSLFQMLVAAYKKSLIGTNQISLSNLVDDHNRNIFHMAAFMNNLELCQLIQKFFPSLCILSDDKNRTALFYSVRNIETSPRQQPGSNRQEMPYSETCIGYLVEASKLDIYQTDDEGRNILHYACFFNNLQQVQYILSKSSPSSGKSLDNPDKHGNTPLHIAASKGHSECLRLLILMGAFNVNSTDHIQRTPLHIAIQNKHITCVEVLVQLGADCTAKDIHQRTPLHYACVLELEQSAISEHCVQILLQDSTKSIVTASDTNGLSPLLMTCALGNTRTLKELLHHLLRRVSIGYGAETIEWPSSFIDKRGWSPMHFAAYHGHGEILRVLLEYFRSAPSVPSENLNLTASPMIEWKETNGMTPLHFACSYPSSSLCVKVLLEKEQDLFTPDKFGRTGLHIAAGSGNLATCKILMKRQPKLAVVKDYSNRIPLDYITHENESDELVSCLRNQNAPEKQIITKHNTPTTPSSSTCKAPTSPARSSERTPRKLRKKSISNVTVRSRTPMPIGRQDDSIPLQSNAQSISFSSLASPKTPKERLQIDFQLHERILTVREDFTEEQIAAKVVTEELFSSIPRKTAKPDSKTTPSRNASRVTKLPDKSNALHTRTPIRREGPKKSEAVQRVARHPSPGVSLHKTQPKALPVHKNSSKANTTAPSKPATTQRKPTPRRVPLDKENRMVKSKVVTNSPARIQYNSTSHPNVFERLNAHAVARNKARKARELAAKQNV